MTTISLTSTILGDETAISADVSRFVVWTVAGEAIAAGKVVRLKQDEAGAVVEVYDYAVTPDPDLPPYGIALATVLDGDACPVAVVGMVPGTVTGILASASIETVTVSTTGAAVRNASPTSDDWVIGVADEQGRLQLMNPVRIGSLTMYGTGSPEGVHAAPVGYLFHRLDGGAGTAIYVKETGTGNTGWTAIGSIAAGRSAANNVFTMNNAASAHEWRKLVNANIDAAANIAVTKLGYGAANEVVKTNAGATALEHGKIADANIATNAAIAITKLAGGTKHHDRLAWNENGDLWKIDPGELKSIYDWRPTSGAAFGVFSGWDQISTDGTASHPGIGTGSFLAQFRRTQMRTGVAANDIAGFESVPVAWRGTGGLGGFFFWARFAMSTRTAGTRCFVGLAESGGNANCAANPGDATSSNCIGIGYDDTDDNWQVIRADGVPNVTKVNTGLAKDGTTVLELRMFCAPTDSKIFVQLYDFNLGVFHINTSYNTTLPTDTMTLSAFAYCGTAASAVAQDLQLYGLRVESHY